jgi:drug/metabolite transporter (DMT)-like permease
MLSFTSVLVALLGIMLLREHPTTRQWSGIGLYVAGVLVYFYPLTIPPAEALGLAVAGAGVLANALSSILGRHVNQQGELDATMVTVVSMGVGAVILLTVGIAAQGMPQLSLAHGAIILWLAVVNTALAFTLWNHTLRILSAVESSIINNTMLFQIAVLAWLLLGEPLTWQAVAGMILAGFGTILVQLRQRPT